MITSMAQGDMQPETQDGATAFHWPAGCVAINVACRAKVRCILDRIEQLSGAPLLQGEKASASSCR